MKTVVRLVQVWGLLGVVSLLIYVGLILLGFGLPKRPTILLGLLAVSLAAAILLVGDEQTASTKIPPDGLSFAGLIYLLLSSRRSLLTLIVLVLVGSGVCSYYLVSSLFRVERSPGGLVISLPGQTVTFLPIHAEGWQDTGIKLRQGQEFQVELWGRVSPGALLDVHNVQVHMSRFFTWVQSGAVGRMPPRPALTWPFTGPEGYKEEFYQPYPGRPPINHYKDDDWLTVKGLPHNTVVGILLDGTEPVCADGRTNEPCRSILDAAGRMRNAYDWRKDAGRLMNLSSEKYPKEMRARREGTLWVTINDADEFRWDNSGFFFLKLVKR